MAEQQPTPIVSTAPRAMPMLEPPEAPQPVAVAEATDRVPLDAELKAKVERQVDTFVGSLLGANLDSDEFRQRLDAAFRLGREEISNASALLTGRFMERNFVGIEQSPAFKAIQDLRGHLDDLNPGKEGDLLSTNKVLGVIPWGNKLQAYFRKFQSAGTQLQASLHQIYAARDDMQRDAIEVDAVRAKLWEAMQRLKAAIHFGEQLDARLAGEVERLKASDPNRARALEQEVLFYARQSLQDMQVQQAVCVNGYLSLDVLKKTAREMVNGCNRVATTGMSALATAQTVARATGNQIEVMNMLQGVSATIGDLVTETSRQLGAHVQATGEFAANPLIGVDKLKEMFDNTFKALDDMDAFRSAAIATMGQTNAMLKEQIARGEAYAERVKAAQTRAAAPAVGSVEGPVAL